jgi:hypothetical protein
MEHIKEAFSKVKQDIDSLKIEVHSLSEELKDTRQRLIEICGVLKTLAKKSEKEERIEKEESRYFLTKENSQKINSFSEDNPKTPQVYSCPFQKGFPICINPVFDSVSFQNNPPQPSPYIQDNSIPTQNSNLPTDIGEIKTHPAHNFPYKALKDENKVLSTGNEGVPTDRQTNQQTNQQTDKGSYNTEIIPKEDLSSNYITHAAKILDSLDNIKKEVRLKFK